MLDAEHELIQSAQRGGAEAFGKIYDHYLPPIYRYVFAKVNRRAEAEDIVHEVFLSAWQGIGRYRERGLPFSSWLYRIARNRIIDYYRLAKPTSPLDELDPDTAVLASTAEGELETALAWERARKAIGALRDDEQEVLILRFVNDLTPREIARIVEKSEGAVRVMQHRAIAALRRILAREPAP